MLLFNEALSSAKSFVYSHTNEVGYLRNNISRYNEKFKLKLKMIYIFLNSILQAMVKL